MKEWKIKLIEMIGWLWAVLITGALAVLLYKLFSEVCFIV